MIKKYISYLQFLLVVAVASFLIVMFGSYLIKALSSATLVQSNSKTSTIITPQLKSSPLVVSPKTISKNRSLELNITTISTQQKKTSNQLTFGHFPYQQADLSQMIIVASYAIGQYQRYEYLESDAGTALLKLIYAARNEGIWIVPVSGFRSIEQQQKLFQAQIKRRGSTEAAAKLSAPPGYSEHHTGFTVDLADGHFPKQDVTYNFRNTDAYRWLNTYAKEFGFEMSFPPNNSQGISYEPWHWRYVGSSRAAATFATARTSSINYANKYKY